MNPIDNSNLTNYRESNGTENFVPALNYGYDATNKYVDVTDASSYPSGVALLKVHVRVHDKFGGEARHQITPGSGSGAGNDITVNVASLNTSKGLDITATIICDDHKTVADGSAYNIGVAGVLGFFDKQKNA